MIRCLLRAVGLMLVAIAFTALVVDGSRSIAGGRLLVYPLGDGLAWLGGGRADLALASVGGWPGPMRSAVSGLLAAPGFAIAGALGLAFLYSGRSSGPIPVGGG